MDKLTAELCLEEAKDERARATWFRPGTYTAKWHERHAAALTIAARVLDEGAVEGLARIIDPDGWVIFDRQREGIIRAGLDPEVERGPWMYVARSLGIAEKILTHLGADQ